MSDVAVTIVELDIEVCSLTYGEGDCEAVLGTQEEVDNEEATGTKKCFNCRNTCQDLVNFASDSVTLRFIEDNGFVPKEIEAFPSLRSADLSPAVVSLGEDLGVRASLSASFRDHPHSDTGPGFDKYLADRGYDPFKQGTFWGKFRARQPFLRGREMRLIRGFLPPDFDAEYPMGTPLPDDVLVKQDTRHFVVESFDGLTTEGMFNITAKDALKLADGDRAQAPRLSSGRLNADITDSGTTITLVPSGIGNLEYPKAGYVAIGGQEIVYFTRDPYNGLNANTKLLLKLGGTNGSTTMSDTSGNGRNGTAQGNAQITTADKPFGTGSLILDGTGDYVTVSDNAAWQFSADFTVDAWISLDDLTRQHTIFSHSNNNDTNMYRLYVTTTGAIGFEVISSSSTLISLVSSAGAVSAATWTHVAIVRNSNAWNIYVNGVSVASASGAVTIPNYSSTFRVGTGGVAATAPMQGKVKEFRVQSEAFWTANFSDALPTAYSSLGPDGITINRAQKNTTAQAHSAQARVQLVLSYFGEDPADILADLLINYADVPSEQIPLDAWKAETQTYLNQVLTADIAEPVSVNALISEIVKQSALCMWTDERIPEIKLRVLREVSADADLYDETKYLARSPQTREQPEKRISQVWTYFGMRNPLEGADDADNYRSSVITFDAETETNYGSPVIDKLFSRWIPFGGRTIAEAIGAIRLSRFRIPPRKVNFSLFKNITVPPALGSGCRVAHHSFQDDEGLNVSIPVQITRLNPTIDAFEIEAEEMLGGADAINLLERVIYIDSDAQNVVVKTLHDSIYQAFTDDDVTNGATLRIVVSESVRVGSTSTATYAIDFGDDGDWPEDLPITLEVYGLMTGMGGEGRRGAGFTGSSTYPAFDGLPGGTCLYTRFPLSISVKSGGKLGGGGGGGGGGAYNPSQPSTGGGGGGGAGYDPGGVSGVRPGDPGTDVVGGAGRNGSGGAFKGGDGGDLGMPGNAGGSSPGLFSGAGGAAGNAIDGISYCTILEGDADILGPRIN